MSPMLRLCCLILCTATGFACVAQCPSNRSQFEVTASYGSVAARQLQGPFGSTDDAGKSVRTISGNPFLSARYYLFNRLALGFTGGVSSEEGKYTDRTNPSFVTSTYKTQYIVVAMEFCYIYHFRKYLELYTIAGFGPCFRSTESESYLGVSATDKQEKINMQYTPLGVRFGGRLAGFAEVGIGYKGLFNAGLSYKFGSPCWWRQ